MIRYNWLLEGPCRRPGGPRVRTSLWPPDEEEPPVLAVAMTPFDHADHVEFFASLLPLRLHWVRSHIAPGG